MNMKNKNLMLFATGLAFIGAASAFPVVSDVSMEQIARRIVRSL